LRRLFFAEVRDLDAAERNRRRRLPVVIGPPGIEDFHCFLGNELREVAAGQRFGFRPVGWFRGAIAALIGDDQLDIFSPAQSAVTGEAADGGQVVRFLPEAVIVELRDGRIGDARRGELVE
jgi:hypothetical protein